MSPERRTLLIADDDSVLNRMLMRYAGKITPPLNITSVDNGADALQAIEHEVPEAIISDVLMPGAYGTEVAQTAIEAGTKAVLLVTGNDMGLIAKSGLDKNDRVEVLWKPFSVEDLMAWLRKQFCKTAPDVVGSTVEQPGADSMDTHPQGSAPVLPMPKIDLNAAESLAAKADVDNPKGISEGHDDDPYDPFDDDEGMASW